MIWSSTSSLLQRSCSHDSSKTSTAGSPPFHSPECRCLPSTSSRALRPPRSARKVASAPTSGGGEEVGRRRGRCGLGDRFVDDETMRERDQAGEVVQGRPGIHAAHLECPVPGVRPGIAPDRRVVGDLRGPADPVDRRAVVVVVAESARDAGAGPRHAVGDHGAGLARPESRGQNDEFAGALVAAGSTGSAVPAANRALSVGHPNVHVQAAVRRHAQQPACVVADRRVPQPVAVHDVAEGRGGMEPGPEQAAAGWRERAHAAWSGWPQGRGCRRRAPWRARSCRPRARLLGAPRWRARS